MQPERLDFLKRLDKFYNVITEQVKQDNISESEFYLLLSVKCKAMNKERLNKAKSLQDCAGGKS